MRRTLSWKTALRLGRVSNVPTVFTNVLAGVALTGSPMRGSVLVALCLAMAALYIGGMYLNDAFDAAWDRQHRPERPIVADDVPVRLVLTIGFALLTVGVAAVACMAIFGLTRPVSVAWTAVLASLIVYYDLHHKGNPLGPLIMGLCRVGVYAVAATAVAPLAPAVAGGAILLLGHLIGLTYIAKHETRGRLARLWPLILFAPATVFALLQPLPWWPVGALYVCHTIALGVAPALGWNRDRRPAPARAVPSLIAGISLLDAVVVSRTEDARLVIPCLLAFMLTRYWQRHVPGT